MRIKTTITLPRELLGRLDRVDKNRSALLERAALDYSPASRTRSATGEIWRSSTAMPAV
jgi:hypothetical protein